MYLLRDQKLLKKESAPSIFIYCWKELSFCMNIYLLLATIVEICVDHTIWTMNIHHVGNQSRVFSWRFRRDCVLCLDFNRKYSGIWCPVQKLNVKYRHDDAVRWKHFRRYWPFVRRIHRSPVNSPHKGQWRGALMFSLICAWINSSVNSHEAGDLWRHHAYNDVIVRWILALPSVMVISAIWEAPTNVFCMCINYVANNDKRRRLQNYTAYLW